MGEARRARDTELDREVAIKVLPAEIAGTPTWRRKPSADMIAEMQENVDNELYRKTRAQQTR